MLVLAAKFLPCLKDVGTLVLSVVVGKVGDGHAKRKAEFSVHALTGGLPLVVVGSGGGGGRRWRIGRILFCATLFG